MNIDGIRLFVLTARLHNITQVAREIHISQSAASRQLKKLQEDLGIKLLRRHGRGIELTATGRTFLKEVLPIWSQLEALRKRYTQSQECLTIAASHGASNFLLPSLMTQFSQRYPSAKLTLQTRSSAEVDELLLTSKVDLVVTANPGASSTLFTKELYRRDALTPFVRANNLLACKKLILVSELRDISLVVRIRRDERGRTETQLNDYAQEGVKFKIAMRCESAEAVKEAVRHGAGVGILYRDVVKREIDQGEFKALRIEGLDVVRQTYIAYAKDKPLSAHAREFLALLRASALTHWKAPAPKIGRNDGRSNDISPAKSL